jgi:hypothetical protein
LAISLICGCTTNYSLRIKTIPEGEYSVLVDNLECKKIDGKGNETITIKKASIFIPQLIEIKDNKSYGKIILDYSGEPKDLINVSHIDKKIGDNQEYFITFLFDSSLVINSVQKGDKTIENKTDTTKTVQKANSFSKKQYRGFIILTIIMTGILLIINFTI